MAKRELRPIRVEGQVAYVPLTQGYEAIIDAADVPLVEGVNWCADVHRRADGSVSVVYAARMVTLENGKQRMTMMHRHIANVGPDKLVDHCNGEGLDNRRANLRAATKSQNGRNSRIPAHNSSGYKGVDLCVSGLWRARIALNGHRCELGKFRCSTAAAVAYAKASRELHGEFGRTA